MCCELGCLVNLVVIGIWVYFDKGLGICEKNGYWIFLFDILDIMKINFKLGYFKILDKFWCFSIWFIWYGINVKIG